MNIVYVKSEKAVKEFEQGNRSLSLRHRQLLIMVDGRRSDGDLAKSFGTSDVIQMLMDLEKLGYLLNSNAANKPISSAKNSNESKVLEQSLSQEHLVFIKTFMAQEAQLQLGLMSRGIEGKIAAVQDAESLKSCIAQWHMAIRDSRNGRTVADKLMERLAHLLANPPQAMASNKAS